MNGEPTLLHDARCPSWNSDDSNLCDCRDAMGHRPSPECWADGPMLAFDLESTGVDPATARIVTATIITIVPGRPAAATNWLSDVDGEEIPEGAAKVHGISTEHAREHGRPLRDVVAEVRAVITLAWRRGVPVVGHNVGNYDLTLLDAECQRFNLPRLLPVGPVIDSMLCDRAVDRYRKGKRTLTATCEFYGVRLSEDDAHNSEADALASARLAWKIAKRYPEIGRLPLNELMAWQAESHRKWAEGFGAYLREQGKPDDVDRDWPMRGAR